MPQTLSHRATALVATGALALGVGGTAVALPHLQRSDATSTSAASFGDGALAVTAASTSTNGDSGATSPSSTRRADRREKAIRARLNQLVKDQTLTAAQANAVAAALAKDPGLWRPGVAGLMRLEHAAVQVTAQYTHLSVTQVRQQLQSGKSLADVATGADTSVDGLVAAMTTRAEAAIDKAVTSGRLTQAQADKLTTKLPEALTRLVNRTPKHRTVDGPGDTSGEGQGSGSGSSGGSDGLDDLTQLLDQVSV
ncbi:MAG: hypothetical protein ACTHK1_04990 [Actinomycetales bacterium]